MLGDMRFMLRSEEVPRLARITNIFQIAGTTNTTDPKTHIKAPAAIWSWSELKPKGLGIWP
jgi:hypothetical protein